MTMACGTIDGTLIFFSSLGAAVTAGALYGALVLIARIKRRHQAAPAGKFAIDDTWSRDPWRDMNG